MGEVHGAGMAAATWGLFSFDGMTGIDRTVVVMPVDSENNCGNWALAKNYLAW